MPESIAINDYSKQRQEFYAAKTGFEDFWQEQDYQIIDGGYSLKAAPASLLITNSTIAPYLGKITPENRDNLHDAVIQKCVRLNALDSNSLIDSDEWTTGFHMAGVISNLVSMAKITGDTLTYLETAQKIPKESLFFTAHPDDQVSLEALTSNGIKPDKVLPVEQNGDVWVTWQLGIPGPKGMGITFLLKNKAKGTNEPPLLQFLNVIRLDQFVNQNQETSALAKPVVDMGFGMERLTNIRSGLKPFETVFYKLYLELISKGIAQVDSVGEKRLLTIVDNVRTIKFLLGDGFLPDKRGSGYVLRKLMRNIFLQLHLLGAHENIYQKLFNKIEQPTLFPEIEAFQKILQKAEIQINKLKPVSAGNREKILAFLKDTHGIPVEISTSLI